MKRKTKDLIINILVPIILGTVIGLITKNHPIYLKPKITPPDIIFPIAWTILYTLMGISYYLIKDKDNKKSKVLYWTQLIINLIWPIIFFKLQWFLVSFIWIILLDVYVLLMIISFYKDNKKAAYINIPYMLWLIFATILCFQTYLLN